MRRKFEEAAFADEQRAQFAKYQKSIAKDEFPHPVPLQIQPRQAFDILQVQQLIFIFHLLQPFYSSVLFQRRVSAVLDF